MATPNPEVAQATEITVFNWVTAIGSVSGALITATSVVVAVIFGIKTLNQTRRDSRDRSRPMVAAYLERDPHPGGLGAYLVIENLGQSVAYNVRVTFSPAIVNTGTSSGNASFVPTLLRRYAEPIPNLIPNLRMRNLWHIPDKSKKNEDGNYLNDEPIPDRVVARVRYSDAALINARNTHRYDESFVLDVNTLRGETITTHTNDHLGLHKRSTKAMEKLSGEFHSVATRWLRNNPLDDPPSERD
ncbi:hypothetical protein SEA_BOYNAMEDSUE_66 [Gordonia phage BoyNamedSue]|uniref:Uncharacterized protein n=1 Tax=Gordonia phage BoyNamedSue TaxID=2836009 RepID=A0A8F3E187_9CAUD|nr:hypothetical protein PP491_gp66 [Gordonia phage BoyNamedSue]QWY79527.1 hypothetical protein SEA_BOYNAMEDSUE_66 [Gordonia phage BoyNamedSue]QYW01092.1 membrane protein [Gordonia phage AlumE]